MMNKAKQKCKKMIIKRNKITKTNLKKYNTIVYKYY